MQLGYFSLQNDELSNLADEARTLKDEIDILRHTSDKVVSIESDHSVDKISITILSIENQVVVYVVILVF